MITITGSVLRILPLKAVTVEGNPQKAADLILADERAYWRVALWDEQVNLVLSGTLKVGDGVRIENASLSQRPEEGNPRVHAGNYACITRLAAPIAPLRDVPAVKLTVLAVVRPERGIVCVAGIDEHGSWLRPQHVYESELLAAARPLFRNLCISAVYLDAWRGRRARTEDRLFVYSRGVEKELPADEKKAFLEQHVDPSVDAVFKSGRTLGLIKPQILLVYEERTRREEKKHEQYIRFTFKDCSGRVHWRWPCRCAAFYARWNALKARHRFTCGWRMRQYLKKSETYLAIGLTYTDYGRTTLEYGAYPLIVGVHIVLKSERCEERAEESE